MRKIDQQGVRVDFESQLDNLMRFHATGLTAFTSDADQSRLAEHSLLAIAVAWEGFVSDMFIALINRDCQQFRNHLQNALNEHLRNSGKPERIFTLFGSLSIPQHLSKAQVEQLADGIGNNISFPKYEDLESRARQWLAAQDLSRFTGITAQQKAVVDTLIALRNHIAHRSQRSLDAMNRATNNGVLTPTGLKRASNRFHDVGAWLKAKPVGFATNRLSIIMGELRNISASF
ncbi:HEPN domain-containing protein [Pseudomonas oryzihabitans]|jgi:hypothetical protein|uniref:HEPN domain-containing protein n=1 Tax=Pseudomonas oryzihabitans TaxID=47885 RepID=UPI0025570588|nr:HEPN domain-containing protein [Pseudomonas oryzihabitans]MDK8265652.1 HEPN domain-containing protein [Pseudomonas oryzihabitans]